MAAVAHVLDYLRPPVNMPGQRKEDAMAIVLIVDDNEDVCRLLVTLVSHYGHTGQGATSGEEALRLVRSQPVDLVLDVMMPGMDGPEVLGQIREEPATASLPVVMFSRRERPAVPRPHVKERGQRLLDEGVLRLRDLARAHGAVPAVPLTPASARRAGARVWLAALPVRTSCARPPPHLIPVGDYWLNAPHTW
jgi:CheY-like chemotaxis protein